MHTYPAGTTGRHRRLAMSPEIAAIFFALIFAFMLLFPFVHVSYEGSVQGRRLIQLIDTEFGINIFALLLFLLPVAGIILSMTARRAWDFAATVVAVLALIMVPLTIFTMQHWIGRVPGIIGQVRPGIGTFVFPLFLGILAILTGIATFQDHHR